MKKIIAILFIIISIFLSIGFLIQIPEIITNLSKANNSYGIGYLIGSLLPLVFTFGLFRIGLKWLKSQPMNNSEINNIGSD